MPAPEATTGGPDLGTAPARLFPPCAVRLHQRAHKKTSLLKAGRKPGRGRGPGRGGGVAFSSSGGGAPRSFGPPPLPEVPIKGRSRLSASGLVLAGPRPPKTRRARARLYPALSPCEFSAATRRSIVSSPRRSLGASRQFFDRVAYLCPPPRRRLCADPPATGPGQTATGRTGDGQSHRLPAAVRSWAPPLYLAGSSQTRKRARGLLSFLLIPTGPALIPAT